MGINSFAQCFSRLKVRNPFFRNRNAFTGTGITPHARRSAVDRKTAKAPNLYSVTTHECITDGIEDGLGGVFGITVCELVKPVGQLFNKVASGHEVGD